MNDSIDKRIIIDDSIINQDVINKIIAPLLYSISIYDGEDIYNRDLKSFSKQQQYIFTIGWYDYEVCNGGHEQFYSNSTGIVWEEAMAGFKEIGLINAYNIINESVKLMGGKPSKDRTQRNMQLELLKPDFDDLDTKYFEINDFESDLLDYIRKNRKYFYFNGIVKIPND